MNLFKKISTILNGLALIFFIGCSGNDMMAGAISAMGGKRIDDIKREALAINQGKIANNIFYSVSVSRHKKNPDDNSSSSTMFMDIALKLETSQSGTYKAKFITFDIKDAQGEIVVPLFRKDKLFYSKKDEKEIEGEYSISDSIAHFENLGAIALDEREGEFTLVLNTGYLKLESGDEIILEPYAEMEASNWKNSLSELFGDEI